MSASSITDRPSPNFESRTRGVDLVVLHYTGMQNAEIALERLCDPKPVAGKYPGPWQPEDIDPDAPLGRASAHYVVDEARALFRLVDEDKCFWHAGQSSWGGEGEVNARSIGVEIVNGGHDFGCPDFPDAQIDAVIALVGDILKRRAMPASRVVGHSDIAPARKRDPGEKFPWKRLADAGVAVWPTLVTPSATAPPDPGALQGQLLAIGYGVEQTGVMDHVTKLALIAFQRRFRPEKIDGEADAETRALLAALARQSG